MVEFLQEWLERSEGVAPVWATLIGENEGSKYLMRSVDSAGVVLALPSMPKHGTAYPWTSVLSVTPNPNA